MAAAEGNQYGIKLKDPEIKKKVYDHYCAHISKGKDKTRWYYEDEKVSLTYESLTHYFEREPEAFAAIKRKISDNKGFQLWEEYCEKTATGELKDTSIPALQMVMRNKYGWDKIKDDLSKEKEAPTQESMDKDVLLGKKDGEILELKAKLGLLPEASSIPLSSSETV